jgi:hypothetical protein
MSPKWICVFWAINRWGLAFRTCKTSSSSDGWRAIQQKRALLALLWRLCDRYKIRPCKSQQKTTGVKEVRVRLRVLEVSQRWPQIYYDEGRTKRPLLIKRPLLRVSWISQITTSKTNSLKQHIQRRTHTKSRPDISWIHEQGSRTI